MPLAVTWGTLVATDVVPAQLTRVGAGQAVLVVAKVKQAKAANARARGDVFALTSFTAPAAPTGATTPHGALARRWARLQLDELLAKGNPRAATEHALAWGLVSPYTTMVAIGDQVVVEGGVKHTRGVPVSLPAGMQWQPVNRETSVALDSSVTAKTPVPPAEPANPHANRRHDDPEKEAPKPKKSEAIDKNDEDDDGDYKSSKHRKKKTAEKDEEDSRESIDISGAAPTIDAAPRAMSGASDEEVEVVSTSRGGHYLRFDIALGAGATVVNRDAAFVQTTRLAFEVGQRTAFGGEATLWLGHEIQGTVLGTITRRGLAPRLELGGGIGLHLGPDFGPAIDLALRYNVLRPFALYLRYDGALLFHDSTRDGDNTGTVGIEAHF